MPPDSQACIFLARAFSRLSKDKLWKALCSGEISARVYCVGRSDFAPIPLSPMEFLRVDQDQTFENCQIEVRESDRRRPARIRRLIPVPHWLYVTRDSLEKFVKTSSATTAASRMKCTIKKYKQHWDTMVTDSGTWPSDSEDEQWAKREKPQHH
jgi:hypothetical protein